jgi:Zn-dependent peptidase ImmA (M78 family)/DNA-binding XRE family transcriptional regulator
VEPVFEPSRLSLARRRKGWSRPELAKRTDIKPRTINAYEMGERTPSEENLRTLARALEYPVVFFYQPKMERIDDEGVSFRALSKMSASQRTQALAGSELALELSQWVERQFTLRPVQVPDLHPQPSPEAAAKSLRVKWGLADKPIPHMIKLFEANGVRVFSLAENNKMLDAFSFWHNGKPYVFLNTVKSAERSRFDAAHELGHLVLHQHGQPNGRKAELEANAFASAFLMPASSILAYAPRNPSLRDLVEAKHGWGVSVSALAHRMHKLNLLSEWYYGSLCMQIQAQGYRNEEPQPAARELSTVWAQVFASLKQQEGMSRSDVAAVLSWPAKELRSLVFQLVLSAENGSEQSPSEDPSMPTPRLRLVQ